MKAEPIPSSTMKTFSSGTMVSCPDEGYPQHRFRLKRRTSTMSSGPKHAADSIMGCDQSYQKAIRRRIDCYEFAPRTPPRPMKSTAIPPKLRLPSLDDDGNRSMPMICPRYGTHSLSCSSVSVALSDVFDAAADISDDDCSEIFISDNLLLPLLEN